MLEFTILLAAAAGPVHYLILVVGLAAFGYYTYRHFVGHSDALRSLEELGAMPGFSWEAKAKTVHGSINGKPLTFSQVVEHQYGSPSKFVKLTLAVPPSPHLEVAVKGKLGYNVVHTIWNSPPFFKVGRMALWTREQEAVAYLLRAGLEHTLQRYSETHFQIHLEGERLIITSAHILETWALEDLKRALDLAKEISDTLHRWRGGAPDE